MILVPPDPAWPNRFARLCDEIAGACHGVVIAVEHIGSTSIPGLGAKPIIDVMPGLRAFDHGERTVAPLEALGYEYRGEFGIPGRHYFRKDDPETGERITNVHMYEVGHDEWLAHLALRDYLRLHDDWRERYWKLKQELARQYPEDVEAYAEAKTAFVKEVVALRLAELGSDYEYRRAR